MSGISLSSPKPTGASASNVWDFLSFLSREKHLGGISDSKLSEPFRDPAGTLQEPLRGATHEAKKQRKYDWQYLAIWASFERFAFV